MLDCISYEEKRLVSTERIGDELKIKLKKGIQKIVPIDEGSVRVLYSYRDFSDDADKPCITKLPSYSGWSYTEDDTYVFLDLPKLKIRIDKESVKTHITRQQAWLTVDVIDEPMIEVSAEPLLR